MRDLTIARRAAIAGVISRCPDPALDRLETALSALPWGRAGEMRALLALEVTDRRRRALAFAPLIPLFHPRADGVPAPAFPAEVLDRVWTLASAREPALLPHLDSDTPEAVIVSDRLCRSGAAAVRDRPDEVWPADLDSQWDAAARAGALAELAACFDLAHLVRIALPSLPLWLDRADEGRIAELRLLCRDAAAIAPDGAPRLVEMLFAHVDSAPLILRVVTQTTAVAEREAFLRQSEMGVFVDRLIAALRARAGDIAGFQPGRSDLVRLRADIEWCAAALAELDRTVQPSPASPWGRATHEARRGLAGRMSALLAQAEPALDQALPMERLRTAGQMSRLAPRLDADPAGPEAQALRGLVGLVPVLRGAAAVFGCERDRSACVQALETRLAQYADLALERVNGGDAADEAAALGLIRLSADLLETIEADAAAKVVRRRLAVAGRRVDAA